MSASMYVGVGPVKVAYVIVFPVAEFIYFFCYDFAFRSLFADF
jgi:hypothetical protein